MDECDLGKKIGLTKVQIALGFTSCNFPVAMQFFPKLHSHPCDCLYKFLPNIASTLGPLYELLQKNHKWLWNQLQQTAFNSVKELLSSDRLLVHFNPSQQLVLACNASPYGLGVVLSHKVDGGSRMTYCIHFEISGMCGETILYKLTDYLYQKSLPNIENRVKECTICQQV